MQPFPLYAQHLLVDFEHYLRSEIHKYQSKLDEQVQYVLQSGGKRIRPLLTLLSCEASGGNAEDAYAAALAIEIIHNFTLVHDDIMDNSEFRRGKRTVHRQWNISTAILTGDLMIPLAYRILLDNYSQSIIQELFQNLTNGLWDVCEGQVEDLFLNRETPSIASYQQMVQKKTCSLFKAAVLFGVSVAGDWSTASALNAFADSLGFAFQIQDDALDIFGNPESTGKPKGLDLLEGKITYPIALLYERTAPEIPPLLSEYLHHRGITRDRIQEMLLLLQQYEIDQATADAVAQYSTAALEALQNLQPSLAVETLQQLTSYMVHRKA